MAKNEYLNEMVMLWERLLDTYSRTPAPPMLNSGQRADLQSIIDEMGDRTGKLLSWAAEHWKTVARRLEDGVIFVPVEPRIGVIARHLPEVSEMARQAYAFGGSGRGRGDGYAVATPVPESALGTGPGTSFIVDSGAPSVDEIAEGAARALGR